MKKVLCIWIGLLALSGNLAWGDLKNGLVAYYPFSGNADDESGYSNNGVANGVSLTTDRFGIMDSAYSFDGLNDYIRVPDNDSLDMTTGITIGAWVKPASTDGPRIFASKWDDAPPQYPSWTFKIDNYSDKLRFEFKDPWATVIGNQSILTNEWYHVAATYDGSIAKIYINGQKDESLFVTGELRVGIADVIIGACGANPDLHNPPYYEYFSGKIDELYIYNRALSETEISNLYAIPEPATLSLLLLGGIAAMRWRRT